MSFRSILLLQISIGSECFSWSVLSSTVAFQDNLFIPHQHLWKLETRFIKRWIHCFWHKIPTGFSKRPRWKLTVTREILTRLRRNNANPLKRMVQPLLPRCHFHTNQTIVNFVLVPAYRQRRQLMRDAGRHKRFIKAGRRRQAKVRPVDRVHVEERTCLSHIWTVRFRVATGVASPDYSLTLLLV